MLIKCLSIEIFLAIFLVVIILGIFLLDMNIFARREKRIISSEGKSKSENQGEKYIYIPNIKVWGFSFLVGLVLIFTPMIYSIADKIFRDTNVLLEKYIAWHYLAQIFCMMLILGFVGLIAYMIIRLSRED